MTFNEHLLIILGEECNEVAQRVSKALRFGLDEIQSGQPLNNAERIQQELCDPIAIHEWLEELGVLKPMYINPRLKREKVLKYMEISMAKGKL